MDAPTPSPNPTASQHSHPHPNYYREQHKTRLPSQGCNAPRRQEQPQTLAEIFVTCLHLSNGPIPLSSKGKRRTQSAQDWFEPINYGVGRTGRSRVRAWGPVGAGVGEPTGMTVPARSCESRVASASSGDQDAASADAEASFASGRSSFSNERMPSPRPSRARSARLRSPRLSFSGEYSAILPMKILG